MLGEPSGSEVCLPGDGSRKNAWSTGFARMYGQLVAQLLTRGTGCLPHENARIGLARPAAMFDRHIVRGTLLGTVGMARATHDNRRGLQRFARVTVRVMDAAAQHAVDQHGGNNEMRNGRLQGDSSGLISDGRSIVVGRKRGNFKFLDPLRD